MPFLDAPIDKITHSGQKTGRRLGLIGFSADEIAGLTFDRSGLTDPDETPEAPAIPVSAPGDGKVRIVKEHSADGPVLTAYSASWTRIGAIGKQYEYMFEKAIIEHGSGDGLFEGSSQTTLPVSDSP